MIKPTIVAILCSFLFCISCKKAVEKKAEDIIVKAMTDGQWVVTSFVNNGTDVTTDFSSYKFQYYSNLTVEAIKNGSVEQTGNWAGDAPNMNISANFNTAANPLVLINGTWHITDNSWTYVVATLTVGTETRTLRLQKL